MRKTELGFEFESWVLSLATIRQLKAIKTKISDRDLCMCNLHMACGLKRQIWKSLAYGYSCTHNHE